MRRYRAFGQKVGLTGAQIDELDNYQSSDAFSELEKLVLQYVDDLAKRAETTEMVLDALKGFLTERQLVELNLTVGVSFMTNLFTKSFLST